MVRGYKTRKGIDFRPSSISIMLSNDSYIGNYTYNKSQVIKIDGKIKRIKLDENGWITIKNVFPPIIDNETFSIVSKRKKFNKVLKQTGGNHNDI